MFAYCLNNPVNLLDSTGYFSWLAVVVIVVCVALGATYGATTDRNLAQEMSGQSKEQHNPNAYTTNKPRDDIQPTCQTDMPQIPSSGSTSPNGKGTTTPQCEVPNEKGSLSTRDRINNIIIGASMGFMVGGAIVFMGGAVACVAGYSSVTAAVLGMTGKQAVAWGLLSYNVFPIITAPFLGVEMEPLEYPT